ncbi:MAG: pre-toxin TG domain-containing protein [Candidatus Gracilibacteria bacterium]
MSVPSPTGGSLPTSREKSEVPLLSPATFAAEAAREHKESSDKSQSTLSRVVAFLSESVRKLNEGGFKAVFKDLLDKISVKENFNKAKEFFKDMPIIGKLFDLAEWVIEQLNGVKQNTINGVLETFFGKVLPAGAIAGLTAAIGDKIGLDELLKFKDNPAGLGAFLSQKVKDGTLEVKDSALWEQLSGALGGLPPLSELVGGKVTHAVEVGTDALRNLGDASPLKELRESLTMFLNNNYPGWQTEMAWVKDLSDPKKVMEALGYDNVDQALKDFAGSAAVAGGAGVGSYLLLGRLLQSPKWAGRISINFALYGFVASNEHVKSIIVNSIEGLQAFTDKANEAVKNTLDAFGIEPSLLGLDSEKLSSEKALDYVFTFLKDNPSLTALTALNGAMLSSHFLLTLAYKFTDFMLSGAWTSVEFIATHKKASALAAVWGTLGFLKRRDLCEKLAEDVFFKNDPDQQKKFIDWVSGLKGIGFDQTEKPTVLETGLDPFYKRLIEDPIDFLTDDVARHKLIELTKEGKIAFQFDTAGRLFLGYLKGINPVWNAIQLERHAFESLLFELTNEDDFDDKLAASFALSGEAVVIGVMGWGALKGYKTLFMPRNNARFSVWKLLNTCLNPFSKEARFVLKSALREPIEKIPFLALTDAIQARSIADISHSSRRVLEATQTYVDAFAAGDHKATEKAYAEILDRVDYIKKNFGEASGSSRYVHASDIRLAQKFQSIDKECDELFAEVKKVAGKDPNAAARITERAQALEREVSQIETRYSRLLNLGKAISHGDFRSLRDAQAMTGVSARGINGLDEKVLFKDKTLGELQVRAGVLKSELAQLKEGDPAWVAKWRELTALQVYLDPTKATTEFLKQVDFAHTTPDEAVRRLEQMAYEMEAVEKGVNSRVQQRLAEITARAKQTGQKLDSPAIQAEVRKVDEELIQPFWKSKKVCLEQLNQQYKKLPESFKTNRLKAVFGLAHENTYLTRVVKGARGRAKVVCVMTALMFSTDVLFAKDDAEKEFYDILKDLGPDAAQLIVDILPGIGTYSSYRTAATGKEWITGNTVEGWARWSNWIWGTVGLAEDAIAVIGFIPSGSGSLELNAGARLALASARGSKTAARLVELFPRIMKIAERMGGVEELAKSAMRFLSHAQTVKKGLRVVSGVGMVAGTTVVIGEVTANLIYGEDESDQGFEISPELTPGAWAEASLTDSTENVAAASTQSPFTPSPSASPVPFLSASSKEADIETAGMAQAA